MERVTAFILFILISTQSAFSANSTSSPDKTKHPGFISCSKANQLEQEFKSKYKGLHIEQLNTPQGQVMQKESEEVSKKMASEIQNCVRSYSSANKNEVDESLLEGALNKIHFLCSGKNQILQCDNILQNAMFTLNKHFGEDEKKMNYYKRMVADYFYAKKNYSLALGYYQSAYSKSSLPPCTDAHASILVSLVNTNMLLNDRMAAAKYVDIAKSCENSGKATAMYPEFTKDPKTQLISFKWTRTQVTKAQASVVYNVVDVKKPTPAQAPLASLVPEREKNGDIRGFKIIAFETGSFLEQIGLKKEDVLLKLNGNSLNSFGAILDFTQAKINTSTTKIEFERSGQQNGITVNWK